MFKLYEVDPDADLLLIIPVSPTAFAQWEESKDGSQPQTEGKPAASQLELRLKVSSKHLSLASRHFRTKISSKIADPSAIQPDGRVHVPLEGFDPKAVTIVMNIIHGRGRKVPKSVDVETLAKIATFVDVYQFYDVVEVYADRWIGQLEASLPTTYGRELVFWILVAYVFRRPDLFKSATRLAALHSNGPVKNLGLPIREKIIRIVDSRRQEVVGKALTIVEETVSDLRSDKFACSQGCDSFLLGELIKTLFRNKLASPSASKPYEGVGFSTITNTVREVQAKIEGQPWANSTRARKRTRKRKSPAAHPAQQATPESSPERRAHDEAGTHECGADRLLSGVAAEFEELEGSIEGLELESAAGYYLY